MTEESLPTVADVFRSKFIVHANIFRNDVDVNEQQSLVNLASTG